MKDEGKTFDYQLMSATIDDLDRIKKYKFDSIHLFEEQITEEETNKINYYIETNLPRQIENYKNIIFKGEIIGNYLVTDIGDGYLIDEIYIEEQYRGKGIGSSIINSIIECSDCNIYLWVYKTNKAFSLYKRLGFKIKEETETRYYMEYKGSI